MSTVFLKIVNMSIAASWLILAVLVLRLLLQKAPKWVSVLLWGFVALRLICPVSLESALSLIPSAQTVSPDIMLDWTPEISTGVSALDHAVNPIITQVFAPEPIASANPLQILIPVSANLWLLGTLVLLLYAAVSYWRLCRKVVTAVRLEGNIYQSEFAGSPFVLGIRKPSIYLPYHLEEQHRRAVIAHEKAHIARKDHWWKLLGFLVLSVHWFNPLVWLSYVLLCRDMELACDEKVIAGLSSDEKADYTQALLQCSVRHFKVAACPLAFGEVGVKARIQAVLHYRKPAFWIILVAAVLCIAVAVCFLTDPASGVRNPWVQEYMPGAPGFYGTVDKASYESISEDFAIGADRYGRPVFKNPHKAFQTFTRLYAEGIALIREQNGLRPISPGNYSAYKKLGWQTTSGPEQAQKQAAFASKFLDIYENSFTKDKPADPGEPITQEASATAFLAEILEIWDNCYLVRPVSDSRELSSADKIVVPMQNMEPSPEPRVGDILQIHYDGYLMETYPAQIGTVYSIRVAQQLEVDYGKYYYTIAEYGVYSIAYSTPQSSGGCSNADGSAFLPGEEIWLEGLDGLPNLRGVTVEALGKEGNILFSISVPDTEEYRDVNTAASGGWIVSRGD